MIIHCLDEQVAEPLSRKEKLGNNRSDDAASKCDLVCGYVIRQSIRPEYITESLPAGRMEGLKSAKKIRIHLFETLHEIGQQRMKTDQDYD